MRVAGGGIGLSENVGVSQKIIDLLSDVVNPVELGPPEGWPRSLWIVKLAGGQYGCLRRSLQRGIQPSVKVGGLAAFRHKESVKPFLKILRVRASLKEICEVSYDEAVEIVMKMKTAHAIYLADDIEDPEVVILKDLSPSSQT